MRRSSNVIAKKGPCADEHKDLITFVALTIIGAILFTLQYYGWGALLSWVAFVPVFYCLDRLSPRKSLFFGAGYGTLSYALLGYWLCNLSIASFIFSILVSGVQWALVAFLISSLNSLFNKKDIRQNAFTPFVYRLLLIALLTAYEWGKTKGFLGVSYGVIGYTQWRATYLIQIADLGGVFFISAIIYLVNSLIYECARYLTSRLKSTKKPSPLPTLALMSLSFLSITISLIYGVNKVRVIDARDSNLPTTRVIAIQNNSDPWGDGISSYEKDLDDLIELTQEALIKNKTYTAGPAALQTPPLIVWSETAVVPSIRANYQKTDSYGHLTARAKLVKRLLDFIDWTGSPFLIGNFDKVKDNDYNSALLFLPNNPTTKSLFGEGSTHPPRPATYSKVHLVPFGEDVPIWLIKTPLFKALDLESHLWAKGRERKVFFLPTGNKNPVTTNIIGKKKFSFASPICFEDNFGGDCQEFFHNGARAFISLGNDSWAKSRQAQTLHLGMAVFRSVENHIPTVRATISGVTAYITSSGRVNSRLKEFIKGSLICDIPVIKP